MCTNAIVGMYQLDMLITKTEETHILHTYTYTHSDTHTHIHTKKTIYIAMVMSV